jgi:hypothetical protein
LAAAGETGKAAKYLNIAAQVSSRGKALLASGRREFCYTVLLRHGFAPGKACAFGIPTKEMSSSRRKNAMYNQRDCLLQPVARNELPGLI